MWSKNEQQPDIELFTIYDTKTKTYGQPTQAVNKHDIVRQITNMFKEPEQQQKNVLFINAEDFSLFRIGSYSKSTGMLQADALEHVANLHDLRSLVEIRTAQPSARPSSVGIAST